MVILATLTVAFLNMVIQVVWQRVLAAPPPVSVYVSTSPDYWIDGVATGSLILTIIAVIIAYRSLRLTRKQSDDTLKESQTQFQAALQVAQEANAASLQTIEEMRRAQDQGSAPYVIAYVEFIEPAIYLIIKNVGKSIATDIKLSVDPPFVVVTPLGYDLNNMSFFKDGIAALAPGQEWKTIYAPIRDYLDDPPKNPRKYKMTIKFQGGIASVERTNTMFLDIAAIEGTALINEKNLSDLVKAIEELRDVLKTSTQLQADEIRVLKEGLWIKNPNLPSPPVSLEPGDQLAFIAAQLQAFQLQWLHGYKRATFRIDQGSATSELVDYQEQNTRNDCSRYAQQVIYALVQCQDTLPTQLAEAIVSIATSLLSLGNFVGKTTPGKTKSESYNEIGETLLQEIDAFRKSKDEYLSQLDQSQNGNIPKNSMNVLVDPTSNVL